MGGSESVLWGRKGNRLGHEDNGNKVMAETLRLSKSKKLLILSDSQAAKQEGRIMGGEIEYIFSVARGRNKWLQVLAGIVLNCCCREFDSCVLPSA